MLDYSLNYFCIPNKMNVGLFQNFSLFISLKSVLKALHYENHIFISKKILIFPKHCHFKPEQINTTVQVNGNIFIPLLILNFLSDLCMTLKLQTLSKQSNKHALNSIKRKG